ncbi:MAG: hypothetical protein HYV09_24825 [Deltaproteobacteria bacterium]|nr:hypothetical protein [Deltaproteobacteria bacterium]
MQVEITPALLVSAAGVGLAFEAAIVGIAVMIRTTARDLAKETAAREESERAHSARFDELTRSCQGQAIAIRTLEIRTETTDKTVQRHGEALEALRRSVATLDATSLAKRANRR